MASNFTFDFGKDNAITGDVKKGGNGGDFPKLGHAYIGEITEVSENDAGTMIYIGLKGVTYQDGKFPYSFAISRNSPYIVETIQKITNNVVASNEKMSGAKGKTNMDISKWNNQGLQIGVVFKAKDEKDEATGQWNQGRFLTPNFSIAVEAVADWDADMDAYQKHQERFWISPSDGKPVANKAETPVANLPETDALPF